MDAALSPLLSAGRALTDLLQFDRYVAVGANSGGDQVRRWLAARGKEVVAFTDLSPELHGTAREGLSVLAPTACLRLADTRTAFVIGTIRQREAAELLIEQLGVDPLRVFPFVNPMFGPHYGAGVQSRLAPRLAHIRALLSDDASIAYFDRATAFYRTLDARYLTAQPKRRGQYGYDAPGANPGPGARIVDCGAFIGDSFDDFLTATRRNCRIYALEAFLPNLERMMAHVVRENLKDIVTPLHVAAAGQTGAMIMSGDESIADSCARVGAAGGSHGDIVLGETLDNIFLKHLPTPVDYLKMDIEGGEMEALNGARALLRTYRPVTAVAAYHKPDHIVEIAQFLHDTLAPCRLYAAHDPSWVFQIHYIAVPEERATP